MTSCAQWLASGVNLPVCFSKLNSEGFAGMANGFNIQFSQDAGRRPLLDHLILSLITTHILIDRRQEVTPARRVRIDATIADSKQVCPFEGPIFGQSNVGLGMKVLDMARHRIVVSDIDLAERAQATLISNRFKPTRSVSGGAFVHCVVAHGLPRTGRKSIPES